MRVSPEARFVTICVREHGLGRQRELESAAAAVTDWGRVVSLAASHRVSAFVDRAIRCWELPVPASAARRIGDQMLAAIALRMLLDSELQSVLRALEAAGIPVIVLKGPALARTTYADPNLRPYGDLDLGVLPSGERAAAEVLAGLGYTETSFPNDLVWRKRVSQIRGAADFHRKFQAPGSGALVEMHLDTLQLGLQPRCEADRWRRARPLPGMQGALILGPEDQMVTLALHAHKHGFTRLVWLKDLDLLAREPALDWGLVVEVAGREGLNGSLWYALALSHLLLQTPVGARLLHQLRPSPVLRLLYRSGWPQRSVLDLEGRMRRRAVQLVAGESSLALLANMIVMGRRADRAIAVFDSLRARRANGVLPGAEPELRPR